MSEREDVEVKVESGGEVLTVIRKEDEYGTCSYVVQDNQGEVWMTYKQANKVMHTIKQLMKGHTWYKEEDKETEQEWFLEVGKRYLDTGGTEWRCVGFSGFVPNMGDQIAVMEAWRSNEIKRFFINGESEDRMHRICAEVTRWGKTPVLNDELAKMLEEDDAD